jgi:N-glycosylase/DNA lyase
VEDKSNEQFYTRRLRVFGKKGQYIIDTIKNIYLNDLTIKEILKHENCIQETRKNIISYSCGLGPKQASMFLRNIGYHSEFAVLDKHVIDYMRLMGLTTASEARFSNIAAYQKIEMQLKSYAESFNVNLFHLDLAIWTTMRNLKYYHE